jgi:hypothetical protein
MESKKSQTNAWRKKKSFFCHNYIVWVRNSLHKHSQPYNALKHLFKHTRNEYYLWATFDTFLKIHFMCVCENEFSVMKREFFLL